MENKKDIERVARAMAAAEGRDPDSIHYTFSTNDAAAPWREYVDMARAAIEAMDMDDTSVRIILDRWPETESQFEGLISVLRVEFRVQVERRRQSEAGSAKPYPPLRFLRYHDFGR